ncbi:restriction endonuclease subunit S [Brachyspira aalborgi]|uniref:Type I restriction modification DNA specificity domain-containing protein n=1 Tax=Brachyspira aalborgi TaxID=29522 RepID=A0A5C8ECE8_9SPIR|nr:restriction endonuclease subunit S [Brachyspira aalborgi]TXJ35456.1 hypothetical protein EPJ78_11130 [Brachyspira aalborgi]
MTAKQLKNSILKKAFDGKLTSSNLLSWEIKTIGEICQINPKNEINDELEVSFIPMNLILDKFQNKFSYEIRKWKNIKKGYTHFKNNCIALAKITPCFENGKCVILKDLKNGYGAGTTELIILLPNLEKVIVEYIFYFLNTQYFQEQGKRNFKGTAGQLRISYNFVSDFPIPLPPIEEQKRIVNKLNQLMPLIEEYEEKENKLNELDKKFPERLKKSILKEAFDGKLIKSYNKKTLEEICIYSTSNIAIKDIKNKKGNYPVYGASGIIGYVDFYSKEKECVAVVKDGSIGKVFLLPAKSSVISTLCYLENIEILNIKYLYYFLQSINFIKYKKGSMIPHIYFKDYKKEKVIIPPIEEQKRIVEKLDKLINACEELKKILFI